MNAYIVMTASAKMPSKVKAPYRRVAVVQTDGSTEPKMISERAKGVVRIVQTWEGLHARGVNTAYAKAYDAAQKLAAELNARATQ